MNAHEIATVAHVQILEEKIEKLIEQVSKLNNVKFTKPSETFLRAKEVLKLYGISKTHLYNLKIEGKIPCSNELGVDLYPQSLIDKLLLSSLKNSDHNTK